jgi:hypothetical protein
MSENDDPASPRGTPSGAMALLTVLFGLTGVAALRLHPPGAKIAFGLATLCFVLGIALRARRGRGEDVDEGSDASDEASGSLARRAAELRVFGRVSVTGLIAMAFAMDFMVYQNLRWHPGAEDQLAVPGREVDGPWRGWPMRFQSNHRTTAFHGFPHLRTSFIGSAVNLAVALAIILGAGLLGTQPQNAWQRRNERMRAEDEKRNEDEDNDENEDGGTTASLSE